MLVLLCSGISVVSLEAAEFRGSKIISFVYEQNLSLNGHKAVKALMKQSWLDDNDPLRPRIKPSSTSPQSNIPANQPNIGWIKSTADIYFQNNAPSLDGDALFVTFLFHIAILPSIPLTQRAQQPVVIHPGLRSKLTTKILPHIFSALEHALCLLGRGWISDLDGRVFLNLLSVLVQGQEPKENFETLLGPAATHVTDVIEVALDEYSEVRQLPFTPAQLSAVLNKWKYEEILPPSEEGARTRLALLPFESDVFAECLKPIQSGFDTPSHSTPNNLSNSVSISPNVPWFSKRATFTDDQHWHRRGKTEGAFKERKLVLYGEKQDNDHLLRRLDREQLKKKKERNRQQFLASIHRHAATLTGATWMPLRRLAIPLAKKYVKDLPTNPVLPRLKHTTSQQPPMDESGPARPKPKKTPKSQQPKLTSVERLRLRIQEEKASKVFSESEAWWQQQLNELSTLPNLDDKAAFLVRLQMNTKRLEDPWLWREILLYQLNLDVSQWISDERRAEPSVQARYCVDILRSACEIFSGGTPSDEGATFVRSVLQTLGFPPLDIFHSPEIFAATDADKRRLTFQPVRFARPSRPKPPLFPFLCLPTDPISFQLEHYGVYMDRSMDGYYDPRVSFIPDAWQRDVLDRLDRRESVLVVAPTSAGKTFVSYYAMEQVLRESDDGILVYVAPTKALVNQVIAEISARYDKTLKSGTLWAGHTRDWRIYEPQQCQILVTVPDMLAIMLLSPALAAKWIPRLRWIVLDEIHTIGQQDGGAVWEQLILFSPCPIIGLSATIGNPEEFTSWLRTVEEARGFRFSLVHHKHRYSHLRKFSYTMFDKPVAFEGLATEPPPMIKPIYIHPMSVLASGLRILPDDLSLESADCLTLYKAMGKVAGSSPTKNAQLASLQPDVFFAQSSNKLLTQKDIVRYESALKLLLTTWSEEQDSSTNVLRPIGRELSTGHELCPSRSNKKNISQNLLHFLHDLFLRNDLPAILFNFDRQTCEDLARSVTEELQRAEVAWKKTNPEWQERVAQWKDWKAKSKQRQRASASAKKKKPEKDILKDASSWEETFDPEEALPEFSFANFGTSYSKGELRRDIEELERVGVKPWAIKALQAGVAVHHSGMNRKYRTLIESLFRIGFIRVVLATGTLALGINMPVKTSVFLGDSAYLSALTYRQCAGRAGRRGMDQLGKVIFYGIPMDRIYRIMASKVPPLTGNMPLTTTLTLRLCNLLHGSEHAASAVKSIKSVLHLPQLSLASNTQRDEVLHHLRFSIEYLRRVNLLNSRGEPLTMFPIVAHLYYTEPSNLALIALLRSGVLHRLCDTIDSNSIDTKRNLVSLLAHLFARRKLPPVFSAADALERLRPPKCPSQIVLPPMPSDAYEALREHNEGILQIYQEYAISYATQFLRNSPDQILPISKAVFPVESSLSEEGAFSSVLRNNAVPIDALSTFVANSGVTTAALTTVGDLARTTRAGLHLDRNAVPAMDDYLDLDGRIANGYVFDYFLHGQIRPLVEANRIRQGDVWPSLNEFSLCLATIKTGLKHYFHAMAEPMSDDDTNTSSGAETGDDDGAEFESGATSTFPSQPEGVTKGDWKVYRTVVLTKREFDEKFKGMWA